jgi:acetoin utilization deacetylase AcuC-like enzyme
VQIHHGNGTQEMFQKDPNVLFISLHRCSKDFYPGVRSSGGAMIVHATQFPAIWL